MTRPLILGFLAGAIGFVCGVIAALQFEAREHREAESLPNVEWAGW